MRVEVEFYERRRNGLKASRTFKEVLDVEGDNYPAALSKISKSYMRAGYSVIDIRLLEETF